MVFLPHCLTTISYSGIDMTARQHRATRDFSANDAIHSQTKPATHQAIKNSAMNHANNKRITMALFAALLSAPVLAQGLQIHEENYFLPAYHESKVNQDRFAPMNPNGHEAKSTLIQFQLSLKYQLLSLNWNPLAQALNPQALNQQVHEQQPQDGIYVAYTQRSNWEAYDDSAYFRDHQYNPEIFYRIHGSLGSSLLALSMTQTVQAALRK